MKRKTSIAETDSVRVYLTGEKMDDEQTAANRQAVAECMAIFNEQAASKALMAGARWAAEHQPGYAALVAERDNLRDRWRQLRVLLATAQTA